ncbi:MAG: ABC transporter ATP-binding protein [Planctomycetia bacterium]
MSAAGHVLEAVGLSVGYPGGFALELERLVLPPGAAVAVLGPSGSGMTTLLQALCGILPARAGRLEACGITLADGGRPAPEALRRRLRLQHVGLVLQELELLEHLAVRDNILLAWHLGAHPAPWAEGQARAQALGEALGLGALLGRRPRRLSQGERQRVAVARALAPQPALLRADEPTASLDARNAARVVDLLLEAARTRGSALLLVTHDEDVAARMDRVLSMERLPQEGTAGQGSAPAGGSASAQGRA